MEFNKPQDIFSLSGFIKPKNRNQTKRSHNGGCQLGQPWFSWVSSLQHSLKWTRDKIEDKYQKYDNEVDGSSSIIFWPTEHFNIVFQ